MVLVLALSFFASVLLVVSPQPAHAEALSPWVSTTSYPNSIDGQSCVVSGGFIYCVGGTSNPGFNATNAVYYAPISSTRAVGMWTSTTSYPTTVEFQSCVASGGFIYCVGGNTATGMPSAVYYAPISSSGVGAWTSTASYPSGSPSSCVTSGGHIYCIGGSTFANSTAVYYAPLSSSGVGSWSSTTSYPTTISGESCAASEGFIYCVGGQVRSGQTGIAGFVYYAPLSSSGVGMWTRTTDYPIANVGESCVISGGFVYCVGGRSSFPPRIVSDVYFAPVSSSGVGTWTATTSYPTGVWIESCVTSGGFVYCVGGDTTSSGVTSAVYYTAITPAQTSSQLTVNTQNTNGQTITGYYTVLYHRGSIVATGYSPVIFTLNNGKTYTVQVNDYRSCHFSHWADTGSTSASRKISITGDTQLTAVYSCGTSTTSTINVSTTNSAGTPISGYYTILWQNGVKLKSCFSPCSFTVNNGQTYQIAVADYGGETFSHWSDGTTTRFHMVNVPSSSTTITLTAVYSP